MQWYKLMNWVILAALTMALKSGNMPTLLSNWGYFWVMRAVQGETV
jgi:hypothetical protein